MRVPSATRWPARRAVYPRTRVSHRVRPRSACSSSCYGISTSDRGARRRLSCSLRCERCVLGKRPPRGPAEPRAVSSVVPSPSSPRSSTSSTLPQGQQRGLRPMTWNVPRAILHLTPTPNQAFPPLPSPPSPQTTARCETTSANPPSPRSDPTRPSASSSSRSRRGRR